MSIFTKIKGLIGIGTQSLTSPTNLLVSDDNDYIGSVNINNIASKKVTEETILYNHLLSNKNIINLTSTFLKNYDTNVRKVIGNNNNAEKNLGYLVSLGSDTSIDFNKVKGRTFTIIGNNGSWFTLIANYGNIPSNSIALITNNGQIENVISATFILNNSLKWVLLNYERRSFIGCDCPLIETWGKASNVALPFKTHDYNEDLILVGDNKHFYNVIIKGKVSKYILDNSLAWDYSTSGVFVFLVYKNDTVDPWQYPNAKQENYVSGDTVNINQEFLIYTESALIISAIFSHNNIKSIQTQHIAILNHDRFEIEVEVYKCCKTQYQITLDIPESLNLGATYTFTSIELPFDGYYDVNVFIACEEREITGTTNLNQNQSRTLTVESNSSTYGVVDVSDIHLPITNIHDMNVFGLQGSRIIKTIDQGTGRQARAKINFPVGTNNRVSSGYMTLKYLGTKEITIDN